MNFKALRTSAFPLKGSCRFALFSGFLAGGATGTMPSATEQQQEILETAAEAMLRRRAALSTDYLNSLVTGKKCLSADKMIRNLSRVADSLKFRNGQESADLHIEVRVLRNKLKMAISKYDRQEISKIHDIVYEITEFRDPSMIEKMELKRQKNIQNRFGAEGIEKMMREAKGTRKEEDIVTEKAVKAEVQKEERERANKLETCTWTTAVVLLVIALAFVLIEFWTSQTNPAVSTQIFTNETLTLPTVFACLTIPLIAPFTGLPNATYPGHPMWGVRSYFNVETNETVRYPQTMEEVAEESFMGAQGFCQRELRYMWNEGIRWALKDSFDPRGKCYSCFKINQKKPVVLNRSKSFNRQAGAVTVEFSVNKGVDFCYHAKGPIDLGLKEFFRTAVTEHANKLVERKVVEIVDDLFDVKFALQFGFEDYDAVYGANSIERVLAETAVLCNLYFFSGYFYPVKPDTEVRYLFNASAGLNAWQALGDRKNIFKIEESTVFTPTAGQYLIDKTLYLESMHLTKNRSNPLLSRPGVQIYTVSNSSASQPTFHDYTATLIQDHSDLVLHLRHVTDGVPAYQNEFRTGTQRVSYVLSPYRRYNVSFDFKTFETQLETKTPTTTLSEFLIDVFEYVGLFTGICAYSVLVAPIRIYLRINTRSRT